MLLRWILFAALGDPSAPLAAPRTPPPAGEGAPALAVYPPEVRLETARDLQRLLVIETTAGVSEHEIKKFVKATLMPIYDTAEEKERRRPHRWSDAEMIGEDHVKKGSALRLEAIPAEREFSTLHSFRIKVEANRWVHVEVKKGLTAFGGYVLGDDVKVSINLSLVKPKPEAPAPAASPTAK